MSLIQATNKSEIPKSVMDHWFVIYGKQITKEESKNLEQEELKI